MIQDILEKIIIARVYLKDRPEFTLGAKANKKTYEMLLIIFSSKNIRCRIMKDGGTCTANAALEMITMAA